MRFASLLLIAGALFGNATFDEVAAQATAARNANDVPRAIELYRQAVGLNPKWQEGWWFLGTFLYASDQSAAARDAYQHVVELNPNMGPGWGLLGVCEFRTAEYPQALAHIQKSLALGMGKEPQIGDVLRYHEAVLLGKTGNFDTAIERFAPFVRAGTPTAETMTAFGVVALRLPLVPTEVPPDQRDLIKAAGKAAVLAMRGDPAADGAFRELLERFPKAKNVHFLYATHLLAIDQPHAIAEFERELEANPHNAAAESMLALAHSVNGEAAQALTFAERAVKDDPASAKAQYTLGRVLVETGQVKPGIDHLEAAIKLDPASVENHVELATAYPKAGRYEDAKRERFRTLELMKEQTDAAAH
ncbi:MAG TPA: tetratricopeptide repeat protein [Bryobacteraceae bacterium]|jgi:tetratricopeptide (TPR) repeat protein